MIANSVIARRPIKKSLGTQARPVYKVFEEDKKTKELAFAMEGDFEKVSNFVGVAGTSVSALAKRKSLVKGKYRIFRQWPSVGKG